jgi:hypothetical protein
VLGLTTGLVIFSGRAVQERNGQRLQAEVELTQHWLQTEIESASSLPSLEQFSQLNTLPGPVQLALVLPQGDQYVLVLYCLGGLPEGFPYDEPSFKQRYGALKSALYRWESKPFAEADNPPTLGDDDIDPADLTLVSAYLRPEDTADPGNSGLVFVPTADRHGGLLIINGLRVADFRGEPCGSLTQGNCHPMTNQSYVYLKSPAPSPSLPPEPPAEVQ